MKRRLAKLALFLLLGAIFNVALAWGLSLWIDPFSIETGGTDRSGARIMDEDRYWFAYVRSCAGGARLLAGVRINSANDFEREFGDDPREILPRWWEAGSYHGRDRVQWTALGAEARGWPMLSMWHEVRFRDHVQDRGRMESPGGIELPLSYWRDPNPYDGYDQPRTLPLRLIWPGFAINTVFYAAMLWLPFAALGRVRRRRRIKRGLCPACAYPVSASEVCTECGKPMQQAGS